MSETLGAAADRWQLVMWDRDAEHRAGILRPMLGS